MLGRFIYTALPRFVSLHAQKSSDVEKILSVVRAVLVNAHAKGNLNTRIIIPTLIYAIHTAAYTYYTCPCRYGHNQLTSVRYKHLPKIVHWIIYGYIFLVMFFLPRHYHFLIDSLLLPFVCEGCQKEQVC